MVLFYIDGKQVNSTVAKQYYLAGLAQNGLMYDGAFKEAWEQKSRKEEAREIVFDYSAIQEQGGLEIIIEED